VRTLAELVALEPRVFDYPPSTVNLSEKIASRKQEMRTLGAYQSPFGPGYWGHSLGRIWARTEELYDARERALQRAKNRGVK